MNVQQKTKGFTIIEVVLVLAIAGLIFLLIFLALPALQRNQRDQARRQDIGRLISAVQSYRSNNQGKRPNTLGGTGTAAFPGTYLENFNDANGTAYTFAAGLSSVVPENTAPSSTSVINYYVDRRCNSATADSGKTAVVVKMENVGQYCQEF